MASLLSAISGQFTKSLILGTFLPSLVFVVLTILLVLPLTPYGLSVAEALKDIDAQWQAFVVSFVAVVVTGLLYNFNIPLIRLYEGYLFENSPIGSWMRRKKAHRLDELDKEVARLHAKYKSMKQSNPDYESVRAELALLMSERYAQFPPHADSVAPTELGNVIAAFEHYAPLQYGMDSVTLWTRLLAKIETAYAGLIDDAKTSFDFWLNLSFLLSALAIAYLYAGLYFSSLAGVHGAAVILALAVLAWICYRFSIDSARGWGQQVMGAFDLYRHELLTDLGYEAESADIAKEKDLWVEISRSMLYWGDGEHPPPPYTPATPPATRVEAEPKTVGGEDVDWKWSITKGVSSSPGKKFTADRVVTYELTIRNGTEVSATASTLYDALPQGFDYVIGSATITKGAPTSQLIVATGTNPYSWGLGPVSAGQTVTVRYRAALRPSSSSAGD